MFSRGALEKKQDERDEFMRRHQIAEVRVRQHEIDKIKADAIEEYKLHGVPTSPLAAQLRASAQQQRQQFVENPFQIIPIDTTKQRNRIKPKTEEQKLQDAIDEEVSRL